jgi:DNA excision repair protein ERCC-2
MYTASLEQSAFRAARKSAPIALRKPLERKRSIIDVYPTAL